MFKLKLLCNRLVFSFQFRIVAFLVACMFSTLPCALANEYDVGGGKNDFLTMAALTSTINLSAGDIVNIYPGTYTDCWILRSANGSDGNPITIQGVDSAGNPITSLQETVSIDLANNEGIEFGSSGYPCSWIVFQGICVKNRSGTAIYTYSGGTNIFRYIYFKDNASIMQTKEHTGTIIIEYCEIDGAGYDVDKHCIYGLHAEHLIIQHSYWHDHRTPGHNLIKTRDLKATIRYNYFNTGESQVAIDACECQGDCPGTISNQALTVIGNVFARTIAGGGGKQWIHFGNDAQDEESRDGDVTILNNAFVDQADEIAYAFALQPGSGYVVEISNNIFTTITDLTNDDHNKIDLAGYNNWIVTGSSPDGLSDSKFGSDPGLDANYKPETGSNCIGAGYNFASQLPSYQYKATADREPRSIINGTSDIGAYEYQGDSSDTDPPEISAISASSITSNSVVITWQTNESANSTVEYGTTVSYGAQQTNTAMVTSHSIELNGLQPSTTYHYRVKSSDAAGNEAISGDYGFTTIEAGDAPVERAVIEIGDSWKYFKGTSQPPSDWNTIGFNDLGWLSGPTGIGLGDGDDATVLDDMVNNYLTIFCRQTFSIADASKVTDLNLSVDIDDGFIAYINGQEVARYNVENPGYDQPATDYREPGTPIDFDLSGHIDKLVSGNNVVAVEVHNSSVESSDLSFIPRMTVAESQSTRPSTRTLRLK